MAASGKKGTAKGSPGNRVVATNRQARRNYEILDTLEAGIVLRGSEVKSIRDGQVQIGDAFARIDDRGEVWLHNLTIAVYAYSQAHTGHDETRKRKLLLNRHEIERWRARVEAEHLSLVPLSVYFKDGRAKVELALARGRKSYDKRQAIAERDAQRDVARELARRGRHD
ncbi:MAG TPA: SsrA-binding protein SmpB [Acidimicrobiales bacterium]|nr:SsrA-binding protein SmpB [Acidimicrobiales bacterium]